MRLGKVLDKVLDNVLDKMEVYENPSKFNKYYECNNNESICKSTQIGFQIDLSTFNLSENRIWKPYKVKERRHSRIGHQSNGILFKRKLLQQVLNFPL